MRILPNLVRGALQAARSAFRRALSPNVHAATAAAPVYKKEAAKGESHG